ncbi:MAG: Hint domain-containing protein [Bacteroidota bacterium]|jgi:hypothetical protein
MLSDMQHDRIREAFKKGNLRIQSVSPEGEVVWKRVLEVFRNEVPWEHIVAVTTPYGTKVFTGGHKICTSPTEREMVENLKVGDHVLAVIDDHILCVPILGKKDLPPRQFMYDLTADTWANFVSTRICCKNSPDKFYHFRPPEYEGEIGHYNQIFGQIWEDAELYEYLVSALDWFNMFPPFTGNMITTIDQLVVDRPSWRTAIIWNAISQACFALMANWVVDEFTYSIGGISLDIEKSSKYQKMKDSADTQFDKATEAKVRTCKWMRGLSQPRYGQGVRSSFGPYTARGILSPRGFM